MRIALLAVLLGFAGLCLTGCGSDRADGDDFADREISQEEGDSLINHYLTEIEGASASKKAELYGRAARVAIKIESPQQAANFLQKEILYGEDDQQAFVKLIGIFDEMGNPQVNTFLKAGFAEKYPDHEEAEKFAAVANPHGDSLGVFVDEHFQMAYPSDNSPPDKQQARYFVDASEVYVMYYPDREDSPEKLYKAAESARLLDSYQKAIQLYDWLLERYPDYEKTPQALFLKAYTYDDNLGQYERAAELYQQFMREYPQNEFADDAQFLLDNIGKSDEEILQSLQQK